MAVADVRFPPGFALAQMEIFGVSEGRRTGKADPLAGHRKPLAEAELAARADIELRIAGLAEHERLRAVVRRGFGSKGPQSVAIVFAGKSERARLAGADDRGVTLRLKGMETSLSWERVGPRDLAGMASAYAGEPSEHLAVAKLLLACGEKDDAAKAFSLANRAGLPEAERETAKALGAVLGVPVRP